jgi:hypothetical protein
VRRADEFVACLPTTTTKCAFRSGDLIFSLGDKLKVSEYVDVTSPCYGINHKREKGAAAMKCCDSMKDWAPALSKCFARTKDACVLDGECSWCGDDQAQDPLTKSGWCTPMRSLDKICAQQIDGVVTEFRSTCSSYLLAKKTVVVPPPTPSNASFFSKYGVYLLVALGVAILLFFFFFCRGRYLLQQDEKASLLIYNDKSHYAEL